MAFPVSPTNGQTAVVNNITYQFSNVGNTWTRILSTANIITANTLVSNGYVSAVGNVYGSYIIGNVACASGIFTTKIFNGNSEANIGASGGNANISIGGTANVAVFATTGEYITGVMSASGNVTGGNLLTAGSISATGTLSVTGNTTLALVNTGNVNAGNLLTGGVVSATANIVSGNVVTGGLVTATGNVIGGNILTAGVVSSTGNVTGSYYLGNGRYLTGINAFSTISVTGQSNVVANTISSPLTFAAGTGIAITTDAGNAIVTLATVSTTSIFATGGSMGKVTESVTASEDLGSVTSAVTVSYALGLIAVDGVVLNNNIVPYTITGDRLANNFTYGSNLSVTGNIYSGGIVVPNQDQVVAYIFAF